MVDENYSSFTKTGPNKGNYKPDEPENHRKERKEGKGATAREKKTSNSLFIVWTMKSRYICMDVGVKSPTPMKLCWFIRSTFRP